MTLETARLFHDIGRLRSLSRGAEENEISQSAASQQVQELEKRFGVPLLDRSTRPLTLTSAGKLFHTFCRDLLKRRERFDAELETLTGSLEGTVRVASIYSVGLSEMSRLREHFAERCPHAQLEVEYLRPDKLYESVLADRADLGLVSYPEASREISVISWREEEMAVAAAPTHPLARKKVVLPADLKGQDFVGFDEDLSIRRELDRFLREHGIEIRVTMHFDNIQMIKEAVALGSGISLLPARTMEAEIGQGRLVSIALHAPELTRPVGIIHRRRKKFSRAAKLFLNLLRSNAGGRAAGGSPMYRRHDRRRYRV